MTGSEYWRPRAVLLMEKVKRGFNNVIGQEVLNAVASSDKKGWCKWLVEFFRPRNFEVEWDGKVRGRAQLI